MLLLFVKLLLFAYLISGFVIAGIIFVSGDVRKEYNWQTEVALVVATIFIWPFIVQDIEFNVRKGKGTGVKIKAETELVDKNEN
jgi:hypothetical protein